MFKLKNIKKNDLMKYAKLKPKCFHSSALLDMKMYDRKKNEMGSKIKMMNNNMINNNILRNKTYRCGYDNNDNAYNYVSIRRYALEGPPKIKFTKDDDKKKGWISTTITKTMKYIPEWKTVKIKLKNLPEVIKEELIHYYKGFKLLFKNMKLSSQLVLRILKGEKLKRSESALLERTVADTFRLVPFIIILVVPFMEFTLPVLLKLFPNMLPSTFTTKDQKQQKIEKQIHARLGLAKFLQGATEKLLLEELKGGVSEEDFLKFTKKIKNGEYISNDEIINFGRVFKDKFELNNLSVERVQALCEFFGISKLGPRSFLLFQLDSKLKSLKNDDEQILSQGTEGLSMEELVQINMQRGMKIEGRNRAMLVKQLYDWIQLSTNKEVPKFLLLLSRSFSVNQGSAAISAAINQLSIEEIEDIIKDLPDEAEEFQKRIDELNEIQKEKKREEKEKKEQEELKRKEEEKKKKEEEELKRKLDEEEREKQRLLQEEEKKKKAEEDEKRKLEEGEKKRLEAEKLRIQEEEKTKQQQTQPETKQVEEEKKGDLKTELGEVESEQKFIHQLEERTHSPQSEKLADKVEEIIEKSKQQIENLEREVKEKEEEEKFKKEKETVVVETVVTVETDKEVKDDEVVIENLETLKDQEEYDTQQRLEEDTELLDKELETVSVDQKFIQQLEEKAQVKEVEMLTDKIEEMIERSKAELEKLQKSSSSPNATKKDDEKKVDEEKKEDDV